MTELTSDLWNDGRRARVVRLCARLSGDRNAAEDLAQETLLEAWRSRHKLHDPSGADRWLAVIARHVCLRWLRARGGEPARSESEVADPRSELEQFELVELLDRALGLLQPDARDVLVRRYLHDATHAEIAASLGVSEDAVSMRLARGKRELRRLLAPDEWRATRVWCSTCGRRTLLQRTTATEIAFRCPACDTGAMSHHVDLTNPFFARLMGDVARPTAILGRLAKWSRRYFEPGVSPAACPACAARTRIVLDGDRLGLCAVCATCGRGVSSSVRGIAGSLPEVRAFRRARIGRGRLVEHGGVPAVAVRCEDVLGTAAIDAVFARDTLRLLTVSA